MNKRLAGYWVATVLFCLALGAGGVANLVKAEPQRVVMESLGYPLYMMTILGAFKVLGVIALLVPGFARLKEWAYAGFTFDLIGAAASHILAGDPVTSALPPLVLMLVGAASYWLRPESRRL